MGVDPVLSILVVVPEVNPRSCMQTTHQVISEDADEGGVAHRSGLGYSGFQHFALHTTEREI